MANKFRLSILAASDIAKIYKYTVRNFGKNQAIQYDKSLKLSAKTLAVFPEIGRKYTTRQGNTFNRYSSGSHVIFYTPEKDGVLIVRILHNRMDFDAYLDQSSK